MRFPIGILLYADIALPLAIDETHFIRHGLNIGADTGRPDKRQTARVQRLLSVCQGKPWRRKIRDTDNQDRQFVPHGHAGVFVPERQGEPGSIIADPLMDLYITRHFAARCGGLRHYPGHQISRLSPVCARVIPVCDLNTDEHPDHDDEEIERHREPVLIFYMFGQAAEDHGFLPAMVRRLLACPH